MSAQDDMYLFTQFPYAERVQLLLLQDRYGFTFEQLEEIKTNWIKDTDYEDYYYKPGGRFDTGNPKDDSS